MVRRTLRWPASILVVAAITVACGTSRTNSQMVWPAYAPGYGVEDQRLVDAAAVGALGIVVVDYDLSARGYDGQLDIWIRALAAKHAKVFGYVPVCDGSIGPDEPQPNQCPGPTLGPTSAMSGTNPSVRSRIQTLLPYKSLAGVYLDQGPLDNGATVWADGQKTQKHYGDDIDAVHAANGNWKVMVEAAGYDQPWLAAESDLLLLWEDNCKPSSTGPCNNFDDAHVPCPYDPPDNTIGNCKPAASAPAWWNDTKKVVNTLCEYNPDAPGLPPDMATMSALFKNAWKKGVGYLGVTTNDCHDKLGAIPKDSGYWDSEVRAAK
jgi:hypothetical protein